MISGGSSAASLLKSLMVVALALGSSACSSCEKSTKASSSGSPVADSRADDRRDDVRDERRTDPPREPPQRDDPNDPNKLVYLVSSNSSLYSFSPRVEGLGAYKLVGRLACTRRGGPQSMSVDRNGWAWVFFNSGELFKVSLTDASCRPTSYVHPSANTLLGMGFTSVAPGSADERLYVVSPDFGLATLSTSTLSVASTGKLRGMAELTGGGDGKLFHFESASGTLNEIDLGTQTLRVIHHFENLSQVSSFAFARYAGRFYVFTARSDLPSRVTEYDPRTKTERVRDQAIGFAVVGAGQSTLVPRSDGAAEVYEDFPDP